MTHPAPTLRDLVAAMRPTQWTKNAVVLAAFFFAYWDRSQGLAPADGWRLALPAAVLFCLVSSAVYLLNDVRDLAADRAHPVKHHRPIAAGRITPALAVGFALGLLAAGISGAWCLSPAFAKVVMAYVGLQILYSFGLKRVALLDVFMIAIGFVMRAIAGALVLAVDISPWLLLCTFLLALFLALCKRRQEKLAVEERGVGTRASLDHYDARLLDLLIAIAASATIVSYAIYTMSETTVTKFGTHHLGFTIPFVVFGIFRYLDLAYRKQRGERPELVLLTDATTLVNLGLYLLALVVIFAGLR